MHDRLSFLLQSFAFCVTVFALSSMYSSAHAQQNLDDLCPDPTAAANDTPNSLVKVQQDIERYTLCVQRAMLVSRLNDMSGDTGMGASNLELKDVNLPVDIDELQALIDETKLLNETSLVAPDASTDMPGRPNLPTEDDLEIPATEPVIETEIWFIDDISGTGGNMEGRLVSNYGSRMKVRPGQSFGEDMRVVSITLDGVTIEQNGDRKPLDWAQQ